MSNQTNDQIKDEVIDIVDKIMSDNPTIPNEARNDLLNELYQDRLEGKLITFDPTFRYGQRQLTNEEQKEQDYKEMTRGGFESFSLREEREDDE